MSNSFIQNLKLMSLMELRMLEKHFINMVIIDVDNGNFYSQQVKKIREVIKEKVKDKSGFYTEL